MATKYGGYMGKILQIDLTNELLKSIPLQTSCVKKPWVEKPLLTIFLPRS